MISAVKGKLDIKSYKGDNQFIGGGQQDYIILVGFVMAFNK